MHRFFIKQKDFQCEQAIIIGSDVLHITRVLRLEKSKSIRIIDENGKEYQGVIQDINPNQVIVNQLFEIKTQTESKCKVTLYQSIPKTGKMEYVIQKCVELGVYEIVPVLTERSVVHLQDPKDRLKKQERWQKIAEESAKQCKRVCIPQITLPCMLDEAIPAMRNQALMIVPWEEEKHVSIKALLHRTGKQMSDIGILVGPEGGLSSREINGIKAIGGIPITLGKRILRTETCGMVVLTIVLYEMDELGGKM